MVNVSGYAFWQDNKKRFEIILKNTVNHRPVNLANGKKGKISNLNFKFFSSDKRGPIF
jgi:hypothetical protein